MEGISDFGIIILAAGNSSRLGEPKQLLLYKNKTLLRHVTEEALALTNTPVIVVTGSKNDLISLEMHDLPATILYNAHWPEGMASSIRAGLSRLISDNSSVRNILFAVSDQPFVTSTLFRKMLEKARESQCGIIACSYENTLGTPVLFTRKYFNELLNLTGTEGAKKLVKCFANDVASVDFPEGTIDIDTREDYQKLLGYI